MPRDRPGSDLTTTLFGISAGPTDHVRRFYARDFLKGFLRAVFLFVARPVFFAADLAGIFLVFLAAAFFATAFFATAFFTTAFFTTAFFASGFLAPAFFGGILLLGPLLADVVS